MIGTREVDFNMTYYSVERIFYEQIKHYLHCLYWTKQFQGRLYIWSVKIFKHVLSEC